MPDYDVGVAALSVPESSAPKATYRPAVSVRNNGIHDALASGILRIYAAGQLVFTTELYSPTIPPGETKDAQATDYWTPDTEGQYLIIADVTCPLDQYEPNNHLPPTTVTITGEPAPPPSPVEPHAAQHEEGGGDEISIDGLRGRVADQQPPLAHHHEHELGGSDQLSVDGLPGQLSAGQTPIAHGNAYHAPSMATSQDLADHVIANPAHASAANLANRDTSGPLLGLVPSDQLALGSQAGTGRLYLDVERYWHIPVPTKLICLWPAADPVPEGWQLEATPPPSVLVVYIQRIADP